MEKLESLGTTTPNMWITYIVVILDVVAPYACVIECARSTTPYFGYGGIRAGQRVLATWNRACRTPSWRMAGSWCPLSLVQNESVGRHTGERPQDDAVPTLPRQRILVLSVLVTLTLVAWGVLVFAAIDFGREARSGEPDAWTFLALASVGATACLFVTMILGARLIALIRRREAPPARTARVPGRRVAR